jgi:hypothetical protein
VPSGRDSLPGTRRMTVPRLSAEQRQPLELLASDPHGATEELLVLAHGFDSDMIAGLVRAKFATARRDIVRRAARRSRSSASGSRPPDGRAWGKRSVKLRDRPTNQNSRRSLLPQWLELGLVDSMASDGRHSRRGPRLRKKASHSHYKCASPHAPVPDGAKLGRPIWASWR